MCTAKATHVFSKKSQHICVSLDVNFNESLTNDIVSFEQLGPEFLRGLDTLASYIAILYRETTFVNSVCFLAPQDPSGKGSIL